ncbi:DUF4185 domain-containing protein [Pseudactinotalea suaedae]|uniref:DUF4185 domain-containing protein n=1 Tax=Pseudactinotalea suaedae TaxID=1524924 RepID=UPI0012E26320|nr:DUF4185 domain-containing protein [Pseudactinotalea suaedae]
MVRPRRLHTALGVTALVAGLGLLGAAPATAGGGHGHGGGHGDSCRLVDETLTFTGAPEPELTEAFTSYGNTAGEWTGGDSTYSIPMRGGQIAWVFSDTFLGEVADDGSRPLDSPFLNNSFVVQDRRDNLRTVTGPDQTSLIGPPTDEPAGWYWVGDGLQTKRGDVQLVALRFWYGGGGSFDFGWESNHLATFDGRSLELESLTPLPSASGVQWASWIAEPLHGHGGYTYIYGVDDQGLVKSMHIARVRGTDLTGTWEYWTGSGWSPTETDTAAVMSGVANEYSVTPYRDGYLLITQDTNELFSRNIVAYTSCSPTGPFQPAGLVYEMPEVGATGSYGNPNIWAYNAHEHPELRTRDTILVTYNVNSFDSTELYEDASIYRPRFIEVEIDVERSR